MPITKLCIFCGVNSGLDPKFTEMAVEIAEGISDLNISIIYGGSKKGLMGTIANAALKKGNHVVGVLPESINRPEEVHDGLSELIISECLRARKKIMLERSDAFLILPGGYGTLDEFFEIMTLKKLQLHSKPVYVMNYMGFWNELLVLLQKIQGLGFISSGEIGELYQIFDNVSDLISAITQRNSKHLSRP